MKTLEEIRKEKQQLKSVDVDIQNLESKTMTKSLSGIQNYKLIEQKINFYINGYKIDLINYLITNLLCNRCVNVDSRF